MQFSVERLQWPVSFPTTRVQMLAFVLIMVIPRRSMPSWKTNSGVGKVTLWFDSDNTRWTKAVPERTLTEDYPLGVP
jgi:hypothetical protein